MLAQSMGEPAERSPVPPQSGDRGDEVRAIGFTGSLPALPHCWGSWQSIYFSTPRDELVAPRPRRHRNGRLAGSSHRNASSPCPRIGSQWQTHEQFLSGMTRIADQLAARYPSDPMACDLQGRVYAYLGRSAEAQQAWERCLQLDARRPDACLGLAKLAIKRGDDATAEPFLRRAWDIDYTLPEVALLLAETLTRKNQADQAAALLTRYVGGVPKSFEGWLQLGQVSLQQGDFSAAQRSVRKGGRTSPRFERSAGGIRKCVDAAGAT